MSGERRIAAPREQVWLALNDPEVLKQSIPGCQSLEKLSDTELRATAAVKIGPISARFTGKVDLLDLNPPTSYRIEGEGQGGVAGFAKGGATVTLSDIAEGTLLAYDVKAQVGGKIAQLGARLIDATAKQYADAFFTRFAAAVTAPAAAESPAAAPVAAQSAPAAAAPVAVSVAQPVPTTIAELPMPDATPAISAPTFTPAVRPLPERPSRIAGFLANIPPEPMGYPLVAWIGGVIFLVIAYMIFGIYL